MSRETSSVLVAGAINTDLVATVERAPRAGETVTGQGFGMYGGGKGANQAVAVARSGVRVSLLGAVGDDPFGSARLADLRADSVATDHIRTACDQASGVALITVEAEGENRIAYIPGATLTITAEDALAALEAVRPAILLAPNELPPAALLALVMRARELGVQVILNAAPDPAEAMPLLPFVDILIANEGEALELAGIAETSPESPALSAALSRLGCARVVITRGADGVTGVDGDVSFDVPPVRVEAVDTTGAGDAFCGALAASLARGATFHDSVVYAGIAGAISVTRAGAQSSIPTREAIEALMA